MVSAKAASLRCYVLDWDVGKTNLPDSKDDVHLTSPHCVALTPVGEVNKCFHSIVGVVHIAPVIPKHASLNST